MNQINLKYQLVKIPDKLYIWLIPKILPKKSVSNAEIIASEKLSLSRAKEFLYSRGYVRYFLSELFLIDPLKIPLEASNKKKPILRENLGYVSWSNCKDALLIGWARNPIGVDIEKKDRFFDAKQINNRFFNNKEKEIYKTLDGEDLRSQILKLWVLKEATIKCINGRLIPDLGNILIKENLKKAFYIPNQSEFNLSLKEYEKWFFGIALKDNLIELNKMIRCKSINL